MVFMWQRLALNCCAFLILGIVFILAIAGIVETQKMYVVDFDGDLNYQWGLLQLRVCEENNCTDFDYMDLPDDIDPGIVIPDPNDSMPYEQLFSVGIAVFVFVGIGVLCGCVAIVFMILWMQQRGGKAKYIPVGFCCMTGFFYCLSIVIWAASFPFYDASPNPENIANPDDTTSWTNNAPGRDVGLIVAATIIVCVCAPIYVTCQRFIDSKDPESDEF